MRQCRTFWIGEVKLPDPNQVAAAEPFAVEEGKVAAEALEQSLAVIGADFAALLEFDDVVADLPIGLQQLRVDGLEGAGATGSICLGNPTKEFPV